MKKLLVLLAFLFASPALATTCPAYTYVLQNGTLADANQVMSNFYTIMNCANSNLAKSGANADITSLSGLTTPLTKGQGGTGNTTGQPSGTAGGVLSGTYPSPSFLAISSNTVLANIAGGSNPPSATSMSTFMTALPAFVGDSGSGGVQGVVPAPATGDAAAGKFLKADGTWTAPPLPSATTSVAGVAALATGAQVITGSDTTHAVTPASLTSQQSIATPGYVTLPGGLTMEWGVTNSIASNSSTSVTLPHTCSTTLYNVVITPTGSAGVGGMAYAYVTSPSVSGFTVFSAGASSVSFYWQAICK